MKSQITIHIHPAIFVIPKKLVSLHCFNEKKLIVIQWLCFTIEMKLFKRNGKKWGEINKE